MYRLPVVLFGAGGVGRSLVRQILDNRWLHAERFGLYLSLNALVDSRGLIVDAGKGLSDEILHEILTLKQQGLSLASHPLGNSYDQPADVMDRVLEPGVVVVDCTAAAEMAQVLVDVLRRGHKIVLANKKPLSLEQETFDVFSGKEYFARSRWEATVGSGLPVIATLNRVVSSGDEIHQISGAFSGTLGFLMSQLQQERPFSEIVQEAYRSDYTEPDPRDDLGGVDVARKALIVARGMGWRLDLKDIQVESLYPAELDSLSVDDFLTEISTLDQPMANQVAKALSEGRVLRYTATLRDGRCRVGPEMVPKDGPLGRLTGTDNLVEFHSRWYTPNPLVLRGRGAGLDATAAGVLSDIVELAFAR